MTSEHFKSLRNYLFSDNAERASEKIEVNQRHLIDKILARYSAEYTIFREVLQNANDANAKMVEICFQGAAEHDRGTRQHHNRPVTSIILRNNGRPFNEADWTRLKRIAEGNPDEEKIGFFGVGFYSLFSVAEEPLVVSNNQCLAFYWKGDQLYARPGFTPEAMLPDAQNWTSIYLSLRESMKMPILDPFAHFICKSLLFTDNIEKIRVLWNDQLLFGVEKKRSTLTELPVAFSDILSKTCTKPIGLFTLKNIYSQAIQFDLDKQYHSDLFEARRESEKSLLTSLWSAAKNLAKDRQTKIDEERLRAPGVFSLFLHVVTAEAKVGAGSSFSQALERVTKKKPPANVRLQVLYSSFDELSASSGNNLPHPVLEGILPIGNAGRLFIGFETHQTTGISMHVAGPFIPTVERESLDFIDKNLAAWNEELVRLFGKVSRIIYQTEVEHLAKLYPQGTTEDYFSRCKHIYHSFHIQATTPASLVSMVLEDEFYHATKPVHFSIPSQVGIVPVERLRVIPEEVQGFVQLLPTFISHSGNKNGTVKGKGFADQIQKHYKIQMANFHDILASLGQLEGENLVTAIHWIISFVKRHGLEYEVYRKHLGSIMVPVGRENEQALQSSSLQNVRFFVDDTLGEFIEFPLPPSCVFPKFSARFYGFDLVSTFHLSELTVASWVDWFVGQKAQFGEDEAEKLLNFLARYFRHCSNENKARIASIISSRPLIRTTRGLQRPPDCYLEGVRALAGDAPVVDSVHRRAITDQFLVELGVQSHIDVEKILRNLHQMKWDHRQLVKYMAEHQETLSSTEIELLGRAKIFPAIGVSEKRFVLSELYIDDEMVRLLGMPILNWKEGKAPSSSSASTRFMVSLGLNTIVPWEYLLRQVQNCSPNQRTEIFRYFLRHLPGEYKSSFEPKRVNFDFLPLKQEAARLGRPETCFTDGPLGLVGFDILHDELQPYAKQLGVACKPPIKKIIERLIQKNFDVAHASDLFEYFSTILNDFHRDDFTLLAQSSFVPFKDTFLRPIDMYFEKGSFDVGINFPVADFGRSAKPFLQCCGVQNEPSASVMVMLMVEDAPSILKRVGVDEYLNLLRWISMQYGQLEARSLEALRSRPILLGQDYTLDDKETPIKNRFTLAAIQDIFIIDDTVAQQAFCCLAVPLDVALENFYKKLGVKRLSLEIKSKWKIIGDQRATLASQQLEELIHMRSPLLIAGPVSAQSREGDGRAKLQKLKIATTEQIFIKREFRSQIYELPTSACLPSHDLLLITENFDYFDVATMLCQLVLLESRLQDALLFSTLLSSSLTSLRTKGFPVDRLLLGSLPGSSEIVKTAESGPETSVIKQEKISQTPSTHTNHPANHRMPTTQGTNLGNLITSLRTKLGRISGSGLESPKIISNHPSKPIPASHVTNHNHLNRLLTEGIRCLRHAQDQASINDAGGVIASPDDVQNEASQHCQVIPSHQLQRIDTFNGHIPIFYSTGLARSESIDIGLMNGFGNLLVRLASTFGISPEALSIYVDDQSQSIAFNRNRSLFFNFSHYEGQIIGGLAWETISASWFMTFCHELAHNFIR